MKGWPLFLLLLTACSSKPFPGANYEDWPEINTEYFLSDQEVAGNSPGSLYSDHFMFALYEDKRAYRVGDILTVELNERTQSSKRADASTDRSTNINVGVPLAGNLNTSEAALQLRSNQAFDGESSASQQNFLRGSITVRVTQVLPNGALAIRGEKWIRLNQGDEYLRLQGLVRPEDIDVANRISSQRIADARISYSAKGDLARANQAGWFSRIFSVVNPF